MRKTLISASFLLAVVWYTGCCASQPLKFHYYSRNLVLGPDRILKIENTPIDFTNLRHELVKRMIGEKTPITLHVHRNVPATIFDAVVNKLKAEGFTNLSFETFSD